MPETNTFKKWEIYGFVVWVISYIIAVIYFIWSFIPDEYLHSLGIYYYPDKHFAKIIPCYMVICFPLVFLILEGNSLYHNLPADSIYCI